jgi:hypothetical protein
MLIIGLSCSSWDLWDTTIHSYQRCLVSSSKAKGQTDVMKSAVVEALRVVHCRLCCCLDTVASFARFIYWRQLQIQISVICSQRRPWQNSEFEFEIEI